MILNNYLLVTQMVVLMDSCIRITLRNFINKNSSKLDNLNNSKIKIVFNNFISRLNNDDI